MTISVEEKYRWLCNKLCITDIDYFEQDAFLDIAAGWQSGMYFQFVEAPKSVDEAVILCMNDWYRNSQGK